MGILPPHSRHGLPFGFVPLPPQYGHTGGGFGFSDCFGGVLMLESFRKTTTHILGSQLFDAVRLPNAHR